MNVQHAPACLLQYAVACNTCLLLQHLLVLGDYLMSHVMLFHESACLYEMQG